jgi:capsular polysaccharide export protein
MCCKGAGGSVGHRIGRADFDHSGTVVSFPERDRTVPPQPSQKPLILLLQGPVGPFFRVLATQLEAEGYDVLKVNFNGGDWSYFRGPRTLHFSGSADAWADWLGTFIRGRKPEAIILFGDSRPYHRQAIRLAQQAGIAVACFEEGYVRPNFITLEWGGNNAMSPLRTRQQLHIRSAGEPVESVKGNLFRAMAVLAIGYYLAKTAGAVFFRGNLHHRSRGILSEAVLWTRNFWRKLRYYPANNETMLNLIENMESRYYVLALQVHDDQQLLRYGHGWTMERLITESLRSFALHAADSHHLVIKIHPMDRGHKSYRPFAMALARVAGCQNRIHIVDDGSIGLLIRHSLGLVTVNSTSGLLALNHGKPLLALGDAVYSHPQQAAQGSALDAFWTSAVAPDKEAVKQFNARMHDESLVNGSFYLRNLLEATAKRVVRRIQLELKIVPIGEASACLAEPPPITPDPAERKPKAPKPAASLSADIAT